MAAKDKTKPAAKPADSAPPSPPKKTKLIILVILAVLLLGGAGLTTYLLLADKKGRDSGHKKSEKEKIPVFVTLEKFTVNLPSADGVDHFLMLGLDIVAEDQKAADSIKAHMPEIRNGLLLLLSSRTVEELSTLDGKKKLSTDILKQINEPLHLKENEKAALNALFSEFVIQ